MKSFAERNPLVIGAVGVALTAAVALAALNYKSLPLINQQAEYSAYLADASGLNSGDAVQVSGVDVGQVESLSLDGPRVLVTFNVDKDVHVGDRSEVAVKTKSLLGAKFLEVTPRGDQAQSGPSRSSEPRRPTSCPMPLGDVTAAISGLNTDQLSQSLDRAVRHVQGHPGDAAHCGAGDLPVLRHARRRDAQLRKLLANANKATGVLAHRSEQGGEPDRRHQCVA